MDLDESGFSILDPERKQSLILALAQRHRELSPGCLPECSEDIIVT